MKSRRLLSVFVALCAVAGLTSNGLAAKFNRMVDLGQSAPVWEELMGVDGKLHGLDDYKNAQALVVVFICNHCPVVKKYEQRLLEFTKQYKQKDVQVVAISASRFPADRFEEMKVRAKTKAYNFPYLHDPTQRTAWAYGATCTPHAFLLNKDRKIAYMGAIDDNQDASKVSHHYLRDAVDAVLADKEPEVVESRQFGCELEYAPVAVQVADPDQYKKLIAKHKGKVVLVDFWATWCLPCLKRFPETVDLSHTYGRDLAVVSMSFDDPQQKADVLKFLQKHRATFDNLICKTGADPESFQAYLIDGAIPHYKLYDRTGKLRHTFTVDPDAKKQFTAEDVERRLKKLMAEK